LATKHLDDLAADLAAAEVAHAQLRDDVSTLFAAAKLAPPSTTPAPPDGAQP
jgi:hypothetical protein